MTLDFQSNQTGGGRKVDAEGVECRWSEDRGPG